MLSLRIFCAAAVAFAFVGSVAVGDHETCTIHVAAVSVAAAVDTAVAVAVVDASVVTVVAADAAAVAAVSALPAPTRESSSCAFVSRLLFFC